MNREQFLILEYENASKLTFHIDELRNKLTSYYITFVGFAIATLSFLLKEAKSIDKSDLKLIFADHSVSYVLFGIAILGLIILVILAKLRRSQLEHFRIINNIRGHFIDKDLALWNVVQLSSKTLPNPSIKSGTFYWTVIVIVLSSFLLLLGFLLLKVNPWIYWCSPIYGIFATWLYLFLAKPPSMNFYSEENLPWVQ